MVKIMWDRKQFSKVSQDVLKQFNITVSDDSHDSNDAQIAIFLHDDNEDILKALVLSLLETSYQMLFQAPDGYIQVMVKSITYIEAFGDEVYMHFSDDVSRLIKEPLYQLEKTLAPYHFIRISKSFIVNITKIKSIKTSFNAKLGLELVDNTHLEVSRSFVKSFKQALGILKKED